MHYTVLLHRDPTGVYEAMIPAVPGCTGKGKTRHEALDALKHLLQDWLTTTEITTIDITRDLCAARYS
jgi:predicted RNase H-like HicB family nuclease